MRSYFREIGRGRVFDISGNEEGLGCEKADTWKAYKRSTMKGCFTASRMFLSAWKSSLDHLFTANCLHSRNNRFLLFTFVWAVSLELRTIVAFFSTFTEVIQAKMIR